jgi:tetratricopeptide (TPR) repeat protein
LSLTEACGDAFAQARTHGTLGTVYFYLGDYGRAMEVLRQSIAALEGELRFTRPGMTITSVRSHLWLAECLGELGEFTEGIACGAEATRIAETAGHLSTIIFAQSRLGRLALFHGDLPRAIAILERALTHCRVADVPLFLPSITATLGLAYALSGRVAEALPLLDEVVVHEDPGRGGSFALLRQGEAYLLAGCPENASRCIARALALSRDRKERGYQAYALRLLGEIAAHGELLQSEQAETHYRQALALAEELGMRPLQAHCHRSLGTLYAKTGQREPAHAELSAALDLYRDMEMTYWLPETEAALAQVAVR